MSNGREAYVIGSGPNGLTAAIELARAGFATTVLEAQNTFGGGIRSAELTLPGFVHDVCSAVHPLALSSPAFRQYPLREYGLEWIQPLAPLANPLDDGDCVLQRRSVAETASALGPDAARYRQVFQPLVHNWRAIAEDILSPLRFPHHPFALANFGALALWPAKQLLNTLFQTRKAKALFAGSAAHSFLPLTAPVSSAFGLVMQISGHAVGWPVPRGGAQSIANALTSYFRSLGGRIFTNSPVGSLNEIPRTALVLCDVSPRQLIAMAGDRLPDRYCRKLEHYRYGPGVFKLDWALDAPIPWRSPDCALAATVHVCGSLEEVAASEQAMSEGREQHRPFVLLVQPSLFDSTRAPAGKHTAWAYCHVPNGSTFDMTERIERQVERFAPGFRSLILARSAKNTRDLEDQNANLIGGDINGGAMGLSQLFLRPTKSMYATPDKNIYLCSASTPPGGAVHGMCGYNAVRLALKRRSTNPAD